MALALVLGCAPSGDGQDAGADAGLPGVVRRLTVSGTDRVVAGQPAVDGGLAPAPRAGYDAGVVFAGSVEVFLDRPSTLVAPAQVSYATTCDGAMSGGASTRELTVTLVPDGGTFLVQLDGATPAALPTCAGLTWPAFPPATAELLVPSAVLLADAGVSITATIGFQFDGATRGERTTELTVGFDP